MGKKRRFGGKRKTFGGSPAKGGIHKWKWFICLILLVLLAGYSYMYTEKVIKPAMTAMAKLKAKSVMTLVVNQSVQEKFSEDIDASQLLEVQSDSQGKVTMMRSDTVAMNRIASDLNDIILKKFKHLEPTVIQVPMGALLGSEIFSQFGPSVSLKILPLGTAKVDFKTKFENTGINQSHYEVYLDVATQAEVIMPFLSHKIEINTVVPIVETVLMGDTPQTYIHVPEDRALEALD